VSPLPLELKAAALLLAVAAGVAGYAAWAHKLRAEGMAQCEAAHAKSDAAELTRREQAKQENERETQRLSAQDRARSIDLAVASVGLRNAGAAAIGRLQHPDPAASGAPASATAGVPAVVSGEVEERLRALARLADERGTAGDACVRAYESLTR
jgi:hypothetical protein